MTSVIRRSSHAVPAPVRSLFAGEPIGYPVAFAVLNILQIVWYRTELLPECSDYRLTGAVPMDRCLLSSRERSGKNRRANLRQATPQNRNKAHC
jgi:hypothetical protein